MELGSAFPLKNNEYCLEEIKKQLFLQSDLNREKHNFKKINNRQ
jgi:hypothetical protein